MSDPFDWGSVEAEPAPMPDGGTPVFDGMAPDHAASRPSIAEAVPGAVRGLGTNRAARGGPRRTKPGELAETAELPYVAIGFGFELAGDDSCAQAFKDNAEPLGIVWDAAAQENDSVRRFLLWLKEGGIWGRIVFAHAPLLVAVTSHHGVPVKLPTALFGGESPNGEPVANMP